MNAINSLFAIIARDNGSVRRYGAGAGRVLRVNARLRGRRSPPGRLPPGYLPFGCCIGCLPAAVMAGRLPFNTTTWKRSMAPVLIIALLTGGVRRRLSRRTLLHLTAAAVLLWLLESQSWLSAPLSPVFGLFGAQSFFISGSIFLNVMQAGEQFALNEDLEGFPRMSRAQLYFGYALLTVITVNWLAAGHNTAAVAQQSSLASQRLHRHRPAPGLLGLADRQRRPARR